MLNKSHIRKIILFFVPPFLYPLLRKLVNSSFSKNFYSPQWHIPTKGTYKGLSLFIDIQNQGWGDAILSGTYDSYFFSYLKKMKLTGKAIFDVGAHIGLSSLPFAIMVGKKGRVIAFEPNPANRDRLILNIDHNAKIAGQIHVEDVALSDRNGFEDFVFSGNIDDGTSSGSFLTSAHTTMERSVYEEQLSFGRTKVRTQTLDSYIQKHSVIPDVIKIDVEGAEDLVLKGAINTLKKHKPLLCIEYHSIHCAFVCTQMLCSLGYTLEVLHEEKDGRVFVLAG